VFRLKLVSALSLTLAAAAMWRLERRAGHRERRGITRRT